MANETKYYKTPFAESGNTVEIPNQGSGGEVDFESGFGPDYEKVDGEEGRKLIERTDFNGLMKGVTENIKQWQEYNYPTWIEDDGDGASFGYRRNMVVRHNAELWVSVVNSNTSEPSDSSSNWKTYNPVKGVNASDNGGELTQSFEEIQSSLDASVGVEGGGGNLTQELGEVQDILNSSIGVNGSGGNLTQTLNETQDIISASIGVSGDGGELEQTFNETQDILNSSIGVSGEGGRLTQEFNEVQSTLSSSLNVAGNGGGLTQEFSEVQEILDEVESMRVALVVSSLGYAPNGDEPSNVIASKSLPQSIITSTRYVLNNPFGDNVRFRSEAEILIGSVWTPIVGGFAGDSDSTGLISGYVRGEGLVIQTARNQLANNANLTLNLSGETGNTSTAPCRIWCYRDI